MNFRSQMMLERWRSWMLQRRCVANREEHDMQSPSSCSTQHVEYNNAMQAVMHEFRDIVIAYGESDEYSFVLRRSTKLHGACAFACTTIKK